jgi:hypothetical protein
MFVAEYSLLLLIPALHKKCDRAVFELNSNGVRELLQS